MREIIFRGLRFDGKGWVYGSLVNNAFFNSENKESIQYIFNSEEFDNAYYEVIPESVGQFTGLTDKNGKEIYEGDILKCKHATEPEENGFVCVFRDNLIAFDNYNYLSDYRYSLHLEDYDYINEQLEITGNIHQKK